MTMKSDFWKKYLVPDTKEPECLQTGKCAEEVSKCLWEAMAPAVLESAKLTSNTPDVLGETFRIKLHC